MLGLTGERWKVPEGSFSETLPQFRRLKTFWRGNQGNSYIQNTSKLSKGRYFRVGVLVFCPKKESGRRLQGNDIVISELGTLHCS